MNTTKTAGDALDLNKLEALALAYAHEDGEHWYGEHKIADGITYPPAVDFIRAANPAAILELIALARRSVAPVQPDDDALIEDAVKRNNVYGVLPNSASTMSIGRAVLAAYRAALARAGSAAPSGQQAAPVAAQFKMPGETWEECSVDEEEVMRKHGYKFRYLYAAPTAAQKEGASEQDAWVSVEDRLPKGECLAVYVTPNGKQRLIRAKYARQFQIEAEGDDCETEYNEDDDTFYIKAGWLECIDNWGEYSSCYVVEGVVTHWRPSPALPAMSAAQAQPKDTTKAETCNYPKCNCPLDAPSDPNWCARGLAHPSEAKAWEPGNG